MPRVTFNRLSKKRSIMRKRRTSTMTRAKYAPKTARYNRSLIKSNAYAIRSLKRLMPPCLYTDYQLTGAYSPFLTDAPSNYFNIFAVELMSPITWAPVLRADANVLDASTTLIKRLQLNLRHSLGESNWVQITTFVVSLRRDSANRIISQATLQTPQDYIYNSQNFNVRVSPQLFKVHYVRNVSLTSNAWLTSKASVGGVDGLATNPQTTFTRGQTNMKLNYRIRQPSSAPWKTMNQEQFPPHQRLYLLSFIKGNTNNPDDDPPRVDYDSLVTCFNAT